MDALVFWVDDLFFWRSTSDRRQNLTSKSKKGHHEDKITVNNVIQVCEVQCAFAVAEVRKVTANLSQTCGFAVAEVRKVTANLSQTCRFAVAELNVNLRCPALEINLNFSECLRHINRFPLKF